MGVSHRKRIVDVLQPVGFSPRSEKSNGRSATASSKWDTGRQFERIAGVDAG